MRSFVFISLLTAVPAAANKAEGAYTRWVPTS
jgi:hypothetical protein